MRWRPPSLLRVAPVALRLLALALILLVLLDDKRVPPDHPDIIEHARLRSGAMLAASGLMLASLVPTAVQWWRDRRRGRLAMTGRCPQCGYDRCATPGRCPECGREGGPGGASA